MQGVQAIPVVQGLPLPTQPQNKNHKNHKNHINHDAEIERNCLAATVVLIAAIVADALTAVDPTTPMEAPTALRCTAAVLVACLGSPPIRSRVLLTQRLAIAAALAGVAVAGQHEASEGTRLTDALFAWVVLSSTLFSFSMNGIDKVADMKKTTSADAPPTVFRESACSLAVSCLFYCGCRVVRAGFAHFPTAEHFNVAIANDYDTDMNQLGVGYAYASSVLAGATVFGGGVAIALSLLLVWSEELRSSGTRAKKELIAISGFLQLFAAFVVEMAASEHLTNLSALFGDAACAHTACPAAGYARRLSMVNQSGTLWLTAFACLVLAYTEDSKVFSREEMAAVSMKTAVVVYGVVAIAACGWSVLFYLDFEGPDSIVEWCAVAGLFGIAVTSFVGLWLGSVIFTAAITTYEIFVLVSSSPGAMLSQLTHCCIFISTFMLTLRTLLTSVTFFWDRLETRTLELLDDAVGLITILGTSIAVFLYLGTAALAITYDGSAIPTDTFYLVGSDRFARTALANIFTHFLPLLVWLPLYRNMEAVAVGPTYRIATWAGAMALPLFVWLIALAVMQEPLNHYFWLDSGSLQFSIFSVVTVPWVAASAL